MECNLLTRIPMALGFCKFDLLVYDLWYWIQFQWIVYVFSVLLVEHGKYFNLSHNVNKVKLNLNI